MHLDPLAHQSVARLLHLLLGRRVRPRLATIALTPHDALKRAIRLVHPRERGRRLSLCLALGEPRSHLVVEGYQVSLAHERVGRGWIAQPTNEVPPAHPVHLGGTHDAFNLKDILIVDCRRADAAPAAATAALAAATATAAAATLPLVATVTTDGAAGRSERLQMQLVNEHIASAACARAALQQRRQGSSRQSQRGTVNVEQEAWA